MTRRELESTAQAMVPKGKRCPKQAGVTEVTEATVH